MNGNVSQFDHAVQAIINGDETSLKLLLKENPTLISTRTTAGHRATLLHYIAANGVENELQKTPPNACAIARILLEAGAEPDAPASIYGGAYETTMSLLVSSWPPYEAGLQHRLVDILLDFGADIDGVSKDGAPLGIALSFGYTPSAETLARRGARVDNIIFAAGLGDLEKLRLFVDTKGNVTQQGRSFAVQHKHAGGRFSWPPPAAAEPIELAFVYACMHGRKEAAEFLLACGVDLNAAPVRRQTALHYAAYCWRNVIVKMLLERGADHARRETQFDRTAREWARETGNKEGIDLLNID